MRPRDVFGVITSSEKSQLAAQFALAFQGFCQSLLRPHEAPGTPLGEFGLVHGVDDAIAIEVEVVEITVFTRPLAEGAPEHEEVLVVDVAVAVGVAEEAVE